jgi:hypothetical protein
MMIGTIISFHKPIVIRASGAGQQGEHSPGFRSPHECRRNEELGVRGEVAQARPPSVF